MKTKSLEKQGRGKTYVFGSIAVQHDRERQTKKLRINLPRFAVVSAVTLALIYSGLVVAGYTWLSRVRKLQQITIGDVALVRWKQVRHHIAEQQIESALAERRAGKTQAAYLAFSSALRNDPDNVAGRIQTADFLNSVNATTLAVNVLKDGLERVSRNAALIEKTFDVLISASRDRDALVLLRGPFAAELIGPNGPTLRTYELLAVLNVEGAVAARTLLEQHPEIRQRPLSGLAVARVLWESKERLAAIDALRAYVREAPGQYSGYALLAQYLEGAGMNVEARETAEQACANIPNEIPPRILRIGTLAPASPVEFRQWREEIKSFLTDFRNSPQALAVLADLSGRKGWVDLSRTLYEAGLTARLEAHVLALHYVDALLRNSRTAEAARILADLDLQTDDASPFATSVRLRQVEVAAASNDREGAREGAKRLASALRQDPDKLESFRRRFELLGATEAAAEIENALSSVRLASKK